MGYSHSWYQTGDVSPKDWEIIRILAQTIIDLSGVPIAGWAGTGKPEISDASLCFNGVDGVEPFKLNRVAVKRHGRDYSFESCKTGHAQYDAVVVAILIYLDAIHSDTFEIHSDGRILNKESEDGKAGRKLLTEALAQLNK